MTGLAEEAEQTICPAPVPEDPADARLTGLLAPAPNVAKKKATWTQKSSRFQVLSNDESEADSSHQGEEEKKQASPPAGGGKKRKASLAREAEGSKKGRTLLPDSSTAADEVEDEWLPRAKSRGRS